MNVTKDFIGLLNSRLNEHKSIQSMLDGFKCTKGLNDIVMCLNIGFRDIDAAKEICVNFRKCRSNKSVNVCEECNGTGVLDFGFYTRRCMRCFKDE